MYPDLAEEPIDFSPDRGAQDTVSPAPAAPMPATGLHGAASMWGTLTLSHPEITE